MNVLPQKDTAIQEIRASAYRIPTDVPESDGTHAWDSTTLVLVEVSTPAGDGVGYTYADLATAILVRDKLHPVLERQDALAIPACWRAMRRSIRNLGSPGIASMAIAAVDAALWDLKAKIFEVPLVSLLGAAHPGVPVYGSGGFTSYSDSQLTEQLVAWSDQGLTQVKMKIGQHPDRDLHRVEAARKALRPESRLFVDANGAYTVKQAQYFADALAEAEVEWFEEPVSSDYLEDLAALRNHAPPPVEIAAGEYGYDLVYFHRMLNHRSVDVLQADATRCGLTGFLQVGALCESRGVPLSAHCAPSLHLHAGCALQPLRHVEYFHDHVRIEQMLFDGMQKPVNGILYPDLSRPGFGLEFKHADAAHYAI